MNFETIEAAALKWLDVHEDFQLVSADKIQNRLYFTCSCGLRLSSFFIICPGSVNENWVRVWILVLK